MKAGKLLILPLFLILVSSTFAVPAYSTEAEEDIQAGCRDGHYLVLRYAYDEYVCVKPDTAKRWVELGMAEIISESEPVSENEEEARIQEHYTYSPPPPPPPKSTSPADPDAKCRSGQTLVYRFNYQDTFCTSPSIAGLWEKLGLVEIIKHANDAITSDILPEKDVLPEKDILPEKDVLPEKDILPEKDVLPEKNEIPTIQNKFLQETNPISSTGISLPEYPQQPVIRSELEKTNSFWSPPKVHQVNERIWVAVGFDIANSIMIEGDRGIIIVDTLSTYESAKKVMNEFRKITDKPVKAIILTHSHLDHVHGTKAFLEEGDGDVEIIAHESLLEHYINENSVLGPIASIRSAHAAGVLLPESGLDRSNMGVFPRMNSGTIAFVEPTHTFSSDFTLDISGVKMELVHVGGEASDEIYVWLPEDDALLVSDNIYAIFPNIYTLRGAIYRDPMSYVNAFDKMIPLEPKHLVPSHVTPVSGKNNVLDILVSTRDATQFIYDQTIRGMNNGYTADELSHMIELPEVFSEHSWITQARGQIPWHVKQIYYGNLGWYEGDPAFLLPISNIERSHKIVNGMGGIDESIQQIRDAIDAGEYNWAAELATYVINVEPENDEAKLLKAHSLRVLGQRMLSADGRHWALTTALILEGKISIDPNAFTQTSPEQLAELPIDKVLKSLPTKIIPEKLGNLDAKLGVYYHDIQESYTLHFRNGILAVIDGFDPAVSRSLTLDSQTHKMILGGHMTLREGIQSGLIEYDGPISEIEELLEYFEPFTLHAEGIRG